MRHISAALVGVLVSVLWCAVGVCKAADQYAGAQVCASCHRDIAATQAKTAMAQTWHGTVTTLLPDNYAGRVKEGTAPAISYELRRDKNKFVYAVALSNGTQVNLPVDVIMGGRRHGLSFLARIDQVSGMPLDRSALVEARYVFNTPHDALAVSPGFPMELPDSYESSLGEVLSPALETKCVTCHGKPETLGAGAQGGVHCESCHGPGLPHVRSGGSTGMVNPKTFTAEQSMKICAQCHIGFSDHSDPMPEELLVSNQVTALKNSECYIQSGKQLACTSCHDPHVDSTHVERTSVNTCLGCHATSAKRAAAVCPVNATGKCLTCHMPSIPVGVFNMTDHWIRVHPEQGVKAAEHSEHANKAASGFPPLRESLRILVTDDAAKADAARQRIGNGEPFDKLAHEVSIDPTAPAGGYLGETWLADINPQLAEAAVKLRNGETSGVIAGPGKYIVLQRMPRDFRWEADQLYREAAKLKARGDARAAMLKDQQALSAYPYFLRALTLMGVTLGERGDLQHGVEIFAFAAQQYPSDATVQFNLGLLLGGLGRGAEQVAAFRRAIALDPDGLPAYESLGAALYAQGDWQSAIATFRAGLQADPLSAKLEYNLSLALQEHGEQTEAERARKLAVAIDPALGSK